MAQDPREAWAKIQRYAQERGGPRMNLPGGPRGTFGGAAGIIFIIGGGILVNNALFNGMASRGEKSVIKADKLQLMVVIGRSNIPG